MIVFIYRDEVYNDSSDNPQRGLAEIIVGKQRNGPVGNIDLQFDKPTSTFRPLARIEDPGPTQMEAL